MTLQQYYNDCYIPFNMAVKLNQLGIDIKSVFVEGNNELDPILKVSDNFFKKDITCYFLSELEFSYKIDVSIPTWEQVLKFFRDINLIGTIDYLYINKNKQYYKYRINGEYNFISEEKFVDYEEAREALINNLISIYEKHNK